ncbi:MAG: hypothetical protein A2172_02975 [Candidatus Woykebacteria bacterium RBG_13_40_15]|uniref:Uncharacterized protein n=1 Tax=Candidatus Woykebacteria bacterium RBG_13_40_15 TaxID=1802593 RepID=A0A1G1W5D3_9BACT|nr:MAG: hypothetical protein A2172_02975 [Candidatus Woykebacteria bacterium RBG_13_40_15]
MPRVFEVRGFLFWSKATNKDAQAILFWSKATNKDAKVSRNQRFRNTGRSYFVNSISFLTNQTYYRYN